MIDGTIYNLIITKTGHRATQYKKIVDTLPVLFTDKNYQGLDEVVWTRNDLVDANFMPLYLDAIQWPTTHHVQVSTFNLLDVPAANSSRLPRFETLEQTHVFDTNLVKELLSEYQQDSKIKSQEFSKFVADKKALIIIIFGQCDEATKTRLALWAIYAVDRQAGRLFEFLKRLHTVCFGDDDGGLLYAPYK